MGKRLKEKCKNLPRLGFPTTSDNLILETNASDNHWGAVFKIDQEKICRYVSGTFIFKNGITKFTFFLLPKKFKVRSNNS